jgi:hypothetical protein
MLADLFAHRHRPTAGRTLARRVLGIKGIDFAGLGGRMREQVSSVRKILADYKSQNPGANWVFSIEAGSRSTGYQLKVKRAPQTPTKNFWSSHILATRETPIICDPLLFFYDHSSVQVTRFMDTNIDSPSLTGSIEELKKKHLDFYKENLVAGHQYLDIGSFLATEKIRTWFSDNSDKALKVQLSYESPSKKLLNSSPIFIGSTRTNAFLRDFYDSAAAKKLRYRLHKDKFAYITVTDPRERDLQVFGKYGMKVSNGVGTLATPGAEMTLGFVARVPNPGGTGHFTVISSDATYAVSKMAEALCDDVQLGDIMRICGWPTEQPLPDTFEWFFLVRLFPGGIADEAKEAELLTWRMPPPPDVG